MHTFLPTSGAIWAKLRGMYCNSTRGRRRVVLAAYVGSDSPSLLPDYEGVEVYCWPQVGATSPRALATLQTKTFGAQVFLADRLHAKLYWVEGVGYLVTSANLSANALGEAGLYEIGLFAALLRIGWQIKRESGSHRTLSGRRRCSKEP